MARRTPRDTTPTEDIIAQQLGNAPVKKKAATYEPVYKVKGDSKIPVSKFEGSVWQSRLQLGRQLLKKPSDAWTDALKYFHNDQLSHRTSTDGSYSGNRLGSNRLGTAHTETENLVFSNVTTLTAVIYAKNPEATITSESNALKPLCKVLEDLLNVVAAKTQAPGIDLKPKAKRAVQLAELTNNGWIEIGWTRKEDSSAAAMQEYQDYVKKLADAKSTKEVEEVEQMLAALESKVAMAAPGGAWAKVRSPFNVITDPTSTEVNLSDADWQIVIDYLPTNYLNCMFADKQEDGTWKSTYQPTHTMQLNNAVNDVTQIINHFTIFNNESKNDWGAMGFTSLEAFNKACYTEVAYVYDKIKRRLLLYATNDWTWPLWVWDDQLKLDRFFPLYRLSFYQAVMGGQTKGEVSYYLDQQDAINEINDEERKSRDWAKRNVLFNENAGVKREDVEAYLKGADGTARGVKLPEGMKWEDVVWSQTPPSFQFYEMFQQQKQAKYESINRISSMNDVLAGVQFKTNTTNQAINSYQQSSSIRTDDRIDTLEDFLGEIFWGLAQLCLMNYAAQDVSELLGRDVSDVWTQVNDPSELRKFSCRIVGGSTQKPTSRAKKEEAIKVAQALGQFSNTSPVAMIKSVEMLEQAFDEITMTDEDWDELKQSIEQQLAPQPQPAAPGQPPAAGGQPPAQGGGDIQQQIAQMPPKLQQVVQSAIEQGVPPETAVSEVLRRTQQPETLQ